MQLEQIRQLKVAARNELLQSGVFNELPGLLGHVAHELAAAALTPILTLGIGRRPGSAVEDDYWLTARVRTPLPLPPNQEERIRKTLKKVVGDNFDLSHTGPVHALQRALFAGAPAAGGLKIGASVGLINMLGGSLGFFAKSRGDNTPGFVSANHVIANLGNQVPQNVIVSPMHSTHPIGKLVRFTPLGGGGEKHCDAAFAQLDASEMPDRSSLPEGGRLSATVALPHESASVRKVGVGTNFTKGTVTSFDNDTFKTSAFAGLHTVHFADQIEVSPRDFADSGDSGSLVYNDLGHAVGLLFAVAKGHAYVNPIQFVLDELKVDIDVT